MFIAIIPTMNEAKRITIALNNLTHLPIDLIIPVINGTQDNSLHLIDTHPLRNRIHPLYVEEPLGLDIPRAFGLAFALNYDIEGILFLDGDTSRYISNHLYKLIRAVKSRQVDMALMNCYPDIGFRSQLTEDIIYIREQVNRTIGYFSQLGVATPSHGPHCISAKLARSLPLTAVAVPPLSLAIAAKQKMNIQVVTAANHSSLGSSPRDPIHTLLTAETIIGDCLQAMNFYQGLPLNRELDNHCYNGYHIERRFDLLINFIQQQKATESP